jgi:YVTN family beta-propeller protein
MKLLISLLIITLTFIPTVIFSQEVIPVGSFPRALVCNSTNYKVYCANSGDNTVSVISILNHQIIATIRVGTYPCAFAYNRTNNKIYCANQRSNDVSLINGATNEIINTVTVGQRPSALLFDSINNKIYCANSSGNRVSVIDGVNNYVVTTINVGGYPTCLALNTTNNKIYTANTDGNSVTIIDGVTNQVISTVPVGISPSSITYNPDNNEIYCSSWANGRIHMISGSTNQVIDSIIYGNSGPQSLIYSGGNSVCYVNFTGDNIKMINGVSDTIVATYQFPVGTRPYILVYSFDIYGYIYCANLRSNNVYKFYYYPYNFTVLGVENANYPVSLCIEGGNWATNLFSATVTFLYFSAIEEQSSSDIQNSSLTIYPNPAKTFFTLHCPLNTDRQTLKLFDISGKLIKQVKITRKEMSVPLNGIKQGIYFVEVGSITKKLIVTK